MSESIFNKMVYMDDVPRENWRDDVGDGYQSVCYLTDADRNGRIVLFGFDKAGNRKIWNFPWKSWIKYNVKYDTEEKDIYDRYVATKWFNSAYARRKYLEGCDGIRVVECMRPESEFLHFMFDSVVLNEDFNLQKIRTHYIDIETEISDQFMPPSIAGNRVNMITVYDSDTEKFYTWSLSRAEKRFEEEPLKDYPLDKFVLFDSFNGDEEAMLAHFIDWFDDNRPGVIGGWNICGYDLPYMYVRLSNVLGKGEANRLSPVGRCYIKEVNHDNARADVAADIEVVIDGLFQSDGLRLYRDKFKVAGSSLDGGYSLDNVGEYEGCGNKIHYQGTLKDLYIKDWRRFYEYNVRDVDLAKRIDDKCKMTSLARRIAGFGLCNYDTIYSSIAYLIGSLSSFSATKMRGKVMTSYLKERKQFSEGFEGAFVFPCVPAIYRGGIGCIDFASLYPSNIRSINASPETYVGKVLVYRKTAAGNVVVDVNHEQRFNPFGSGLEHECADKDFLDIEAMPNGDTLDHLELLLPDNQTRKVITLDQLKSLISEKCIWTANNTLFLKHEVKWGVVAKWCEYFYGLRKSVKKKEMKIFHLLHNKEETAKLSVEETAKLEVDMENYHSMQMALKIMLNSIYGCCGTAFSPIANPHIAQSVTRQGRFANRSSALFVHKHMVDRYGAAPDYRTAASGDTDSCSYSTKIRIKR